MKKILLFVTFLALAVAHEDEGIAKRAKVGLCGNKRATGACTVSSVGELGPFYWNTTLLRSNIA
jgi:hypothetical protein